MPVAVEFAGVDFAYLHRQPVLRGIDLRIESGEFVAVAGPNGGGKTTLLRLALGLERPTHGHVRLFGEEAASFADRQALGYVAQRAHVELQAPVTVRDVVAAGRTPRRRYGRLRASDRAAIEEAIARVGLSALASRPLRRLSGGQQQRAFIAKALAANPKLLVLDEPTTGIDVAAQQSFAELLTELHRESDLTIIYVSHEFGAIEDAVERLVLVRETIVFDGAPDALPRLWHDPSHAHA
jgi:zinc transport system ATP-binding protein